MKNQKSVNNSSKKVWPLYLMSAVLIFGPALGLNALLNSVLNVLLNDPAADTSGRATINIIILIFWALSWITGMALAIVGISRSIKNAKRR